MRVEFFPYTLRNLSDINVLLGKNGCGKSTLLRKVRQGIQDDPTWADAKYISPERGGLLRFDPGVDNSLRHDRNWIYQATEVNQASQFKQQTILQFQILHIDVLQEFAAAVREGKDPGRDFQDYLDLINALLDHIEIRTVKGERDFKIYLRSSGEELAPEAISSGESELIGLAIECLAYANRSSGKGNCLLLLDEPDVHLHPDLQARLMRFLWELVKERQNIKVVIATHSTAILGELSRDEGTSVATMVSGEKNLEFEQIDQVYREVLPVFGAHPLTTVYSERPIFLVEGTDEERIWQQAARTSHNIRFHPVSTDGVSRMRDYEDRILKITSAIYDDATSYELRDQDDKGEALEDRESIRRMRLGCRASENLILTNEVLEMAGLNWESAQTKMAAWCDLKGDHSRAALMRAFLESGPDRRHFDLKELRMVLVAEILDSNTPWEVLVGRAIGELKNHNEFPKKEGSLAEYLGEKLVDALKSF